MKKLLKLGTLTSIALPFISVVACSKNNIVVQTYVYDYKQSLRPLAKITIEPNTYIKINIEIQNGVTIYNLSVETRSRIPIKGSPFRIDKKGYEYLKKTLKKINK